MSAATERKRAQSNWGCHENYSADLKIENFMVQKPGERKRDFRLASKISVLDGVAFSLSLKFGGAPESIFVAVAMSAV